MISTSQGIDVMVFGEALVDFFPERAGVPLIDVELFRRHLGGAPANVAVGLAREGVRAGLMTLVGPDDFGRFVRRALAAEGVDVATVGTHATAKTGVTFVSVGADGARRFLFYRHPSADQVIAPADVDVDAVARARVLHVGSSTLSREPARAATLRAIDAARAAGRIVSTDPNFRPHLWEDPREGVAAMRRLVGAADLVKVSDDELPALVDTADPAAGATALRALGAGAVVVTLGARGAFYDAPSGRGHVAGEVVPVVDATGAGDAFVAGMLAHLLPALVGGRRPRDLDEATLRAACVRGNHLGARAVTALGATTAR